MLRIEDLSYRIGKRVLIDRASVDINPGHRIGLVGRNGTGKTTLLHLITGALEPDTGKIEFPESWRLGITRQEAPSGPQSLTDTVLAGDRELTQLNTEAETATDPLRIAEIHARLQEKHAHSAPSRAARLLAGLGFSEADRQRPCGEFSGGWRMRVALASLLFSEPDLLLLDEPTNHLDLEATLWLEDYLRNYRGTVLIVSHDRGLLNRVPQEILHLEGTKLTLYSGGYDRFENTRRARIEQMGKARIKQEGERARIQKFVDRFRYKASKAKQAQSRLKMLERMEPIPDFTEDGGSNFDFPDPEPLAPPLLRLDDVSAGYDGKAVLTGLTVRIDVEDRIALLGANGNGKSTLIRLLAGKLEAMSGDMGRHRKLRVGYFAQHQTDELDFDSTPVEALSRLRPNELEQKIRNQLGGFGFSQQRANTQIGNLSGGEKARLLFALMTHDAPHILLLDEPTNHLDIGAREALVHAINAYQGAVIIVSHDPHVIELTADTLWLVADGKLTDWDGDLAEYRQYLISKDRGEATRKEELPPEKDRRADRRLAAQRRQLLAPLRQKMQKAEKDMEKLAATKARLQKALADPALYNGEAGKLVTLQKELGTVEKALADTEEIWIAAQEQFEQAEGESL
ncbi:MAG: ATP-binding cassette subfamily F protein 3 [Alphaproteobacteria bacterium]|jgi:ATP-binding cassette subfamily F protein 3